ncbi:MAG: T9SS type A sorting domain-containing protein [Bacteroidales bacterium]|nr:T9SS type A sorting domain-containing protein [Bacteroidales bacterium]
MKKRFLSIGVFSILICGLAALFFISANEQKNEQMIVANAGGQSILGAKEYLALIRNNQQTGVLNPHDVIAARKQIEEQAMLKSGNSNTDLNWIEMGPDNIGGRTRAVIFDNRDANANTLYAGSVTGGLFKSTNLGSSWSKINNASGTANLNVSSIVQADNGTIYVGTGEGLNTEKYTAYEDLGYEGGFVGRGIFKSGNNDNFTRVVGTNPEYKIDFAYVNKLKIDTKNNRIFAATQSSLKYASLPVENAESWSSTCKYRVDSALITRAIQRDSIIVCDSFEIIDGEFEIYGGFPVEVTILQDDTTNVETTYSEYRAFEEYGNVYDIDISSDGWLITTFNGFIYVSESGDPTKFVSRSIYPDNNDYIRKDGINFTTNIIIYDKSNNVLLDSINPTTEINDWHTDYLYMNETFNPITGYPSSSNTGRISFAIAPSNQNIVYAMAAKSSSPGKNGLHNVYLSEDKGNSWRIIAPGGTNETNILGFFTVGATTLNYYYQGDYNNTLTVFPNDPYRVLAGGVNMWEGVKVTESGFYSWEEKSFGNATFLGNGIFNLVYCHVDHHAYVFRPGTNDQFFVGTDGGIYSAYYDGFLYYFSAKNKNYNVTQFYSVDVSTYPYEVLGGTQDNGTQYIRGTGNTPMKGEDMWRPANLDPKYPEGTDGGYVAVSNIRSRVPGVEDVDPPSFYSKSPLPADDNLVNRIRRSQTLGYDYSNNFFVDGSPSNNNFLTPMLLWEDYNNENSRDSVLYLATEHHNANDTIVVRSNNYRHPIGYILPEAMDAGDSIMIQDVVATKFFLATKDEIWMSLQAIRFNIDPEWYIISDDNNNGFNDNPSCIAASKDGNYLFVGNLEGKLYRISNIALAYNEDLADVSSPNCIIATTELVIMEDNTQAVTSVSVDPYNANNVLVTLGNYGNTEYVFYSANALSDVPTFEVRQGDLPKMPLYSSILERKPENNVAILGTEEGIWMTDDITVSNPSWYDASGSMGKVPVLALKQQTNSKPSFTITTVDPGTGLTLYEIYPKITNYGMIYAATHGRGIFRDETYGAVGVEENPDNGGSANTGSLMIYPNPASDYISVAFNLENNTPVQVNIYDLSGKLVQQSSETGLNRGNQTIHLNTHTLTRGTYLVKMVAGNEISTAKLIIVK